jgi:hypothetical protein
LKLLFKALFLSGSLTVLFWYFELASPGQKRTIDIYKDEMADKAKDVGATVVDESKKIYEDRDKYINKAGKVVDSISEKTNKFISEHYRSSNTQAELKN